ncbi:MAG: ATP-binding protein [Peptostreptococcaceae bacterium]|nr:ATP-binding protein [Peptostreptococcaceae bacterium]
MLTRPFIEIEQHPVYTGEYNIFTAEIENALKITKKIISNRIPGIIICGEPRVGKTRAIQLIRKDLFNTFGDALPVFTHLMTEHEHTSNVFYRELLLDLGCGNHNKGTGVEKKEKVIGFLVEKGLSARLKKVILIIDEANCLIKKEYYWLMDIYNRLKDVGINMTVILVGTPNLIGKRADFMENKEMQIIGRFMVKVYNFKGIRNIKDLQRCLSWYDIGAACEYPIGSGWSFTRYFFPEAFEKGKRISSETKILSDLLNNSFSINEIPMMYLCLIIDCLFKRCGSDGLEKEWVTVDDWKTAIDDSCIFDACNF